MSSVAAEKTTAPTSAREAFAQASALHDAGRFAEAEALLRDAIAGNLANASLHNARGVMLAAMGRHAEAVSCYQDALALDRGLEGTWTNLGNALNAHGRREEAVSLLDQMRARYPEHEALARLAREITDAADGVGAGASA